MLLFALSVSIVGIWAFGTYSDSLINSFKSKAINVTRLFFTKIIYMLFAGLFTAAVLVGNICPLILFELYKRHFYILDIVCEDYIGNLTLKHVVISFSLRGWFHSLIADQKIWVQFPPFSTVALLLNIT